MMDRDDQQTVAAVTAARCTEETKPPPEGQGFTTFFKKMSCYESRRRLKINFIHSVTGQLQKLKSAP